MSRASYQESIRRSTILPVFTQDLASVHFYPHADFASLRVFHCDRLHSDLSAAACAANYTRANGPLSCKGCAIGKAHSANVVPNIIRSEPGKVIFREQQSCIRCGRDGGVTDAHSGRIIGRFRTVSRASQLLKGGAHLTTLCMNCFNRGQECRPDVMRNSKGMLPKVHAAFLRDTVISYTANGNTYADVNIGLRSGVPEIRRLLKRSYKDGFNLIEVRFNGDLADPESTADPAWLADKPAKPNVKQRTRTSTRARTAPPVENPVAPVAHISVWDQVFGDPAPEKKKRGISSWSEERQAEYADSLLAAIREAQKDPHGMRDLAQWLLEGISSGPWLYIAPTHKPVESSAPVEYLSEVTGNPWTGFIVTKRPIGNAAKPSAPVADAIALPEVSEPVSNAVSTVADGISNPDPIAEDSAEPSEWDGCFIETDGVRVYVTAYAAEHGISDWDAAIELGVCEPEYADEPQTIDSTANLKSEVCAKCTNEPPKKLTGKQLRKLEKAQRRAERQQQAAPQPAPEPKHVPLEYVCKAHVAAIFALGKKR